MGLALCAGPGPFAGAEPLGEAEERETVLQAGSPFLELQRADRIRVRLRSGESFKARFAAATPDSLFYATDRRPHERSVSFTTIEGLDRRTGGNGHAAAGALIGLLAGAGIGALISTSEEAGTTQWVATTIYSLAGAGGGLVLGAVTGHFIRSDDWAPAWER